MIRQEHGTVAGRQAHRRTKTPPCQPCQDASAHYVFQYRRRVVIRAVDDLLADRPELADMRAAIARFLAGVKENA